MSKKKIIFRLCNLGCICLLATFALGQQGPPPLTTPQLILPLFETNITPATQANTALVGNPGPQTIYYWMVTNFALGPSSPVGPFTVTNAPNTLSASNYVTLTPTYPAGIVSIDLLKTASPTPPFGACNCAVATGETSGTINDQSNATSAYTVAPINVSNYTYTIDNEVQGAGSTHVILRQNGVFVADLSVSGGFTVGGDLFANSSSSQEVVGLRNNPLPTLSVGFLNWNGTAWALSPGGAITGSGTANKIPLWTTGSALGNSSMSDNGTTLVSTNEEISVTAGPAVNTAGNPAFNVSQNLGNSSSGCSNYNTDLTHPLPLQCISAQIAFNPGSTSSAVTSAWAFWAELGPNSKPVNNVESSGAFTTVTSATNSVAEARGVHAAVLAAGPVTTATGSFSETLNQASGSNFTTARAYYAVNVFDAAGAGATNSYGLYVDSPDILSAAIVSHQYGVYIADQTLAGSGTNSDPWGVYEASAGSKNQFGTSTFTGELTTLASSTGGSGFNLPPGAAPTSPVNGDCWTTSAGLFCQIAGATVGPYGSGTGSVSSVSNSDGTLTVSPTTGVVVASLALGHANTWTATQTLPSPILTGTPDASGATQLKLPVAAGYASLANGECGFDSTGLNWHCWNGADALMVPLAAGFTSGDCGQPTLAGGKWTNVDTGSPCGTSSGANPALSNLASVSVNTSLLAQTGVDLGSTTKPFRNVFVFGSGTYGTNYFELTGTPTGTRVFTLPDVANDTFAMLAATQSLTNKTLDGVTPTTMGYVDATSSIQTQLNAKGSGTVTSFSAGTLSPLFTTSVATATSTPALSFSLSNAAQNSVFAGPASGGAGAPSYQTAPTISAANMTSFPTLNQSTTGTAANLTGCTPSAAGDICYYTGSAWTKLAGNSGSTNWLQETSSGTPSWTTPPGTIGSGTTDGVAYYTASTTIGSQTPPTANGIYSVIYNVTASAAVAPTASLGGVPVNAQTGTTYTYVYSDRATYVSFSNASPIAATLPQAGSTGFTSNWVNVSCDIGAGTATITPTTSTISYTNGSAYISAATSMPLTTGQCAWIYSDNTNYFAQLRGGSSGGGDTITSPNSTLAIGGTSTNTTLDLAGAAGEIMAGATPALTYTPTLGKSGTAGTLSMFPATGNFTTTLGSAATASNTVNFFTAVPTNLHMAYCAVSSTTCTLTDTGYAYNAIPFADLTGVAPAFGSVTLYGVAYRSSAT